MSEPQTPETEGQDETLVETLQLERIEMNLFRGTTPDNSPGRIFGGQVIAQSLLAAYETVEGRVCHSLHCYFIRPGDPTVPIVFEVDRSRDGGSFTPGAWWRSSTASRSSISRPPSRIRRKASITRRPCRPARTGAS
jgi:hypothetical protein